MADQDLPDHEGQPVSPIESLELAPESDTESEVGDVEQVDPLLNGKESIVVNDEGSKINISITSSCYDAYQLLGMAREERTHILDDRQLRNGAPAAHPRGVG